MLNALFCLSGKFLYLKMLLVARLYSVNDRMSDECEEVGGMRTGRETHSAQRKPTPNATLSTTDPI
jgi:hypothetical protein